MHDAHTCNRFERLLSLFTVVRAGEGRSVGALCLQAGLLMIAYYLVRPVREALILTGGDAELRSYAVAGQALTLLVVIPLYGCLVRCVPSQRVFRQVAALLAASLLLFGVLGIGVAAGAWAGAQLASYGFEALGPYGLMVVAAGALAASAWASGLVRLRHARRPDGDARILPAKPTGAGRWLGGFAVIARSPYLAGIAALVVLLNWITSTGDYVLASWLVEVARREAPGEQSAFIGSFMGEFCSTITLAAFVLQLLVVSRLINLAGLPRALMVTPVVLVAGYLLVGVVPLFLALQSVLVVQRSLDYSLMNTTRHALFLSGGREVRFEAKTVIDTFFFRMGDLLSTASVVIGLRLLDDEPHGFVWLIFTLSVALLLVVWLVGREYLRREAALRGSARGGTAGGGRVAVAAQ